MHRRTFANTAAPAIAMTLMTGTALAQQSTSGKPANPSKAQKREIVAPDLKLSQDASASQPSTAKGKSPAVEHSHETAATTESHESGEFRYLEISDFFNIREANASVHKGEWEFEAGFAWETNSDGSDDDIGPSFSLKYGITDSFFAEIEVEHLNLGDGGNQGNGELALILFYQWLKESDASPAFATWGEMRVPTGDGSSGVDGELHFNLTKTLLPKFRAHMEGFVETANGARGGDDEAARRNFQWGVGPGFDYSFSDDTIATVNYLMRSSEEVGNHNQNILQFGISQRIAQGQFIKCAIDIGLDGAEETPNFGAKLLYAIEWE